MTKPPLDIALPPGFVDLSVAEGLRLDIRYASANNLVGRDVYGGFDRLWLHERAADKLRAAAGHLRAARPDLCLLVFDGFRPNRVQRIFWDMVRGTDQQRYVADPAIGSVHSFGFAVDLSLATLEGAELDMGTPFDDLSRLAEPQLEARFLAEGRLTRAQVDNRLTLRSAMEWAGFITLPIEWWHFDALPADEVRRDYALVE